MTHKERMMERLNQLEQDRKLSEMSADAVIEKLDVVLQHARGNTGGSRRCAQFILSLWNGDVYKCDLQDLLYIDTDIHTNFLMIMDYIHKTNQQLYSLIEENEVIPVIEAWGNEFKMSK